LKIKKRKKNSATLKWNSSMLIEFLRSKPPNPGEGGLPYESDGDARRKIRIKPLKETNLGVGQALFDP